jgi:hypothetical protein
VVRVYVQRSFARTPSPAREYAFIMATDKQRSLINYLRVSIYLHNLQLAFRLGARFVAVLYHVTYASTHRNLYFTHRCVHVLFFLSVIALRGGVAEVRSRQVALAAGCVAFFTNPSAAALFFSPETSAICHILL